MDYFIELTGSQGETFAVEFYSLAAFGPIAMYRGAVPNPPPESWIVVRGCGRIDVRETYDQIKAKLDEMRAKIARSRA